MTTLARALPADLTYLPRPDWLPVTCCVSRVAVGGPDVSSPGACDFLVLLQSSRARVVMDDADGHLVYWNGYVMGDRCSCLLQMR